MEILSIGEKIRRIRIYKGLTLKDLCSNRISISKMSCIENEKIKPDDSILKFIADKFDVDVEYLKQSIRDQIKNNIKVIMNDKNKFNYEAELEYNLKLSEKNNYNDLCIELLHLLFNYFIGKNQIDSAWILVPKYYGYIQKCFNDKNTAIYYIDIGKYLFKAEEYMQSLNYYNNVINISKRICNNSILVEALYSKMKCLLMLKKYEEVYALLDKLIKLADCENEKLQKAKIYHLISVIYLRQNKNGFQKFRDMAYSLYEKNSVEKANAMLNYAEIMFEMNMKDEALDNLKNTLQIYPDEDKKSKTKFVLDIVCKLIKNDILNIAETLCNNALNESIELNNIVFIERSYYYKSRIFEKKGDIVSAETYMSFSMDALLKFANKKIVYKRYMEMGNMYYRMKNTSESIKYFNFAVQIWKKL
ncbi:helix-turn-helix domain-containing protein [Clostridium tyrobutyricum]|uniref:helix-turn-helix domain-containing protein n=1 Tax=Clostridium tyrobutyricum TaxID=1519 RepID=UPI001C3812DB|nr:helix-turn-helix domain-containing protein [Clostridium tyrobutyricum]MBV4420286.1 helix-turn-helix domain-containing protein [Clostridium tyrobutyricum]